MEELTLPVPVLVDVIPVEQADALILAARQDLAALHQAVESAQLRAEATERRAQAAGADRIILGRAAEGVQRYIEHNRELADGELKGLLEQAADQARERVDRARAETNRHTADARRIAALSSGPTVASDPAPDPGLPASPPGRAEPLWIDPVTPPQEAVPVEVLRSGPSEDWSWLTADPEQVDEVDEVDVADATSTEPPVTSPARRGSMPVFALLQVAGLVAVLVVLLLIVG